MPELSQEEKTRSSFPRRQSRQTRGSRPSRIRLADIRPGEGIFLFGAMATLGGIVAAHVALETARDALFLASLPVQGLALVYMAMAALGYFVSRYERTVARLLGRTNSLILALMGTGLGTFFFFQAEHTREATFALYLWTGVAGTVVTVQFWLFAGARLTPSQGRRLYGLIAAGGVLGAVCGGLVSQLVTEYLPVRYLLLVSSGLQLGTALALTWAPSPGTLPENATPISTKEARAVVQNSPYLRRVAQLVLVGTATALVTDYLFKSMTAENVAPERLGSFLATYYTVLNAAALVVQIFLVMRVLQRAGTIFALALLPLLIVFSGGAMVAFGATLTLVLLTKGADGAFRHSLQRVSTELLFLPLSPKERSSAKPLFDSVLTRGAQGVTALGLLGLATVGLDSPRVLSVVLTVMALAWATVAFRLRGPYLDQFRRSLGKAGPRNEISLDQLTLDGAEVVLEALSSPEEKRVLSAMSVLSQARRTGLIPALVLYHPSTNVVVRALELIPSAERSDWAPLAERLLQHDSEKARLAAVRALGRFDYLEQLNPSTFDTARLQATAAFFGANKLDEPRRHPTVDALCRAGADPNAQRALLRAIAEFGRSRWSEVILALDQLDNPDLDRVVPGAMARTRDPRFLPRLIRRLSFRDGRYEVRRALVAMGHIALDALNVALHAPETHPSVRLHIPRAISRFSTRKASNLLLDALESDLSGAVRYKALRGLGRMVAEHHVRLPRSRVLPLTELTARESLRTMLLAGQLESTLEAAPADARSSGTLLVSLLRDKQRQSLERMMRLLQMLHPNENLRRVYVALTGRDRAAHIAASELLEVLTLGYDEDLRDLVRALSDPTPGADHHQRVSELLQRDLGDEVTALREALNDADLALSALAADFARRAEVLELAVEVETITRTNVWLTGNSHDEVSPPPPSRSRASSSSNTLATERDEEES